MSETDLKSQLKLVTYQGGGDLFGVADLAPVRDFIVSQGGVSLAEFLRAISIGIRLSDVIVDQHSPDEKREISLYWHHVYEVITPALNLVAQKVYRELQAAGYRAFPVPASTPYNRETLKGVISQKLTAHLAGLGWIGKSCLLVTPQFGPRVRLVTVLTDAPLKADVPLDKKCGKCQTCVTGCPAQAFTGREFQPGEPVEMRFKTKVCSDYRLTHACGMCVAICPVGHRKKPCVSSQSVA